MNSDNQLLWALLVILAVIITIILLWKRKSASPSEKEEREEMVQMMGDCVARLEDCRTVDELERKWIHLMDWISSEKMSPLDFGLTPERLEELSKKVLRVQSADFVKKAADGLRELFAAEAEAIDFYHNPLDIGSDPFLQELLEVWKRHQMEG